MGVTLRTVADNGNGLLPDDREVTVFVVINVDSHVYSFGNII
jgi:hypothetical protein